MLRRSYFVWIVFWCLSSASSAESLFVPTSGGFFVTDLTQRQVPRKVELPGDAIPVLAVHPSAPVLATVSETSGVVFWNLPLVQEASRSEDGLYQGIVDLAFSGDGNSLYLLSTSLKSLLVFDLASNKISGVWPLVGGRPLSLQATSKGVLILQSDGATLLDPSREGAVLAQFRFDSDVLGSHLAGDYLYMAVSGLAGLQVYRLDDGQRFQELGQAPYTRVVSKKSGGVFLLSSSRGVESWSKDRSQLWSQTSLRDVSQVLVSRDEQWLYLFSDNQPNVALWSAVSGQEMGKLEFPGELKGVPRLAPY